MSYDQFSLDAVMLTPMGPPGDDQAKIIKYMYICTFVTSISAPIVHGPIITFLYLADKSVPL